MESWVYIFSRFTQEALLFEALLIFIGFAAYAAFYITRRRKYGVADQGIPSNLVKAYLAQLVADAEEMRIQLFGLLGKGSAEGKLFNINIIHGAAGTADANAAALAAGATSAGDAKWVSSAPTMDPDAQKKLKDLEAKMQEQSKALDAVLNEKMRLEEDLAVAKKKSAATPAAPSSRGDDQLSDRVKTLEAQLAEYAVIEDDLANLKRLQKENKHLRTQLESLQISTGQLTGALPAAATDSSDAGELPSREEESRISGSLEKAEEERFTGSMEKAEEARVSGQMEKADEVQTRIEMGEAPRTPQTRIEKTASPLEVEGPQGPESRSADTDDLPAAGDLAEQNFDALVDDVEKSLEADAPADEEKSEKSIGDKSEEELQADFEKMLRS